MQRKIEFRGWHKDHWIYGYYAFFDYGDRELNEHYIIRGCEQFSVLPNSVGEYTGRYDKNRTKIFENDFVNTNIGDGIIKHDYNEGFLFCREDNDIIPLRDIKSCDIEVVIAVFYK